jgi:hypothetical protein
LPVAVALGPSAPPLKPGRHRQQRPDGRPLRVRHVRRIPARPIGSAAMPNTCAWQSHDAAAELNRTGLDAHNNDTRDSRPCSVRFASPSYREALSSCAITDGTCTPPREDNTTRHPCRRADGVMPDQRKHSSHVRKTTASQVMLDVCPRRSSGGCVRRTCGRPPLSWSLGGRW